MKAILSLPQHTRRHMLAQLEKGSIPQKINYRIRENRCQAHEPSEDTY